MASVTAAQQPMPSLTVDFDPDADVLYVSLGNPVPSYSDEEPDGILLNRAYSGNNPSGVTAICFLAHWRHRRPQFYRLVAEYLGLPASSVECEIEPRI
jgi:hypothetical protein